jgi:uncharacterized protein
MKTVHPVADQLDPDPLDPDQIVSGSPETFDLTLAESEDGSETCGFWRCTPGTFTDIEVEESFLMITGEARVEFDDGRDLTFGAGDTHSFKGGEKTVWTVTETVLKAYWAKSQE